MTRPKSPTLTPVELEFMQVIWPQSEVTTDDVADALRRKARPLAGGTVRKMLAILVDKGYLTRRRQGYNFLYKAKVPRSQASRKLALDVLKRAFAGSAANMMAALIDSRAVTDSDIEKIERLIAERKNEEKRK